MDRDWHAVGYVRENQLKRKIIEHLARRHHTPTELMKSIGGSKMSNVSSALADLCAKGYTVCLNPKAKKGRLYGLTDKGKDTCRGILELKDPLIKPGVITPLRR